MEHKKPFESVEYCGKMWVDLSCNYQLEEANAFLMIEKLRRDGFGYESLCIGRVDKNHIGNEKYQWDVTIDCCPDEETGQDVELIGSYHDQSTALTALWDARFRAAA